MLPQSAPQKVELPLSNKPELNETWPDFRAGPTPWSVAPLWQEQTRMMQIHRTKTRNENIADQQPNQEITRSNLRICFNTNAAT
jgi:hypothetical protein